MRKNIFYVFGFIFVIMCFFTCSSVYASSNSVSLSLVCPKEIYPSKSVTCIVNATITGSSVALSNVKAGAENPFVTSSVSTDIKNGSVVSPGSDIRIGTVTAKASSGGGNGRIYIDLDVRFSNNYSYSSAFDDATVKIASPVNTLNSIKIDGATIQGFNKNTLNYNVSTSKSSVLISATRTTTRSTVTGTGTKSLKCGNNKYALKVKAENGSVKNYGVTVNRKCSSSATLKGITVSSGTLSPAFSENVYDYNLKLDKSTDKITITGVKSLADQKISGEVTDKVIGYGKSKVSLVVTSQTGDKKTYNINIEKVDSRDDNSLLSSLSLSAGSINFDTNTFSYETKVLYDVSKIDVVATPSVSSSKVTVTGNNNLVVGDNLITVSVVSEKNKKTDYKIKVVRLKEGETLGNNANIKNITIKGYDFPFKYDRKDYKLVINNEDKLDISVVMDDSTATYEIFGNENIKDGSVIRIVTHSSDGSSVTYTIEITKSSSSTIYFVIGGIVLLLIAICIPLFVYLKSVRKKKELLDVNGYKIDKDYEDDNGRKVIGINSTNNENVNNNVSINSGVDNNFDGNASQDVNYDFNNQVSSNYNVSDNQVNNEIPISNNMNDNSTINNVDNNINNGTEDFDSGLQDYVPNESINRCPGCGRELMGDPSECPYCKVNLK